jgi:hypothetical protein
MRLFAATSRPRTPDISVAKTRRSSGEAHWARTIRWTARWSSEASRRQRRPRYGRPPAHMHHGLHRCGAADAVIPAAFQHQGRERQPCYYRPPEFPSRVESRLSTACRTEAAIDETESDAKGLPCSVEGRSSLELRASAMSAASHIRPSSNPRSTTSRPMRTCMTTRPTENLRLGVRASQTRNAPLPARQKRQSPSPVPR